MAKFSFQIEPRRPVQSASNDLHADMSDAKIEARRPCLVTLECGIQALVEIAGFTYVEGIPVAIGVGLAENIDPSDLLERSTDGVRFKFDKAPTIAGPVDVKRH